LRDKLRSTYFPVIIIALLFFAGNVRAAFEENAGARPFGMAGVFTAIADDCNAISWNAAGLVLVDKTSIELIFSKPFLGMDYDNIYSGDVSLALPLGSVGTVGAGYQLLKSDVYSESTILLAAGVNVFKDFLSLGLTGKWLGISYTQNDYTGIDPLFTAAGYSKTGYSVDAAAMLKFGKTVSVGLVAENIMSSDSLALGTLAYKLPVNYRGGLALRLGDFVPGIELSYRNKDMGNEYVLDFAGGIEWWTGDRTTAIRAGAGVREISAGLTYMFGDIGINYGFSYPLSGLSGTFGSHRVSMNVVFGRTSALKNAEESKTIRKINKMKIALMDLTSQNIDPGIALVVTDLLRNNLFNTGRYSVLERANMDKLIKEQQFQMSGCSSTECAIELGKILNMQEMLVGSVNKLGSKFFINARMVDVESGEIMITATAECYSENDLADACKDITSKLIKIDIEPAKAAPSKKGKEEESKKQPQTLKMKIAVMDAQSQNVNPSVALVVTELLRNNLFSTGKYLVLERANMDKLLKEQRFQSSGCTTTECAIEVGKLLNMKEMVVSSVNKLGSKYMISARMVDVESGELTITATAECYSENDLSDACKEIAGKLTKR